MDSEASNFVCIADFSVDIFCCMEEYFWVYSHVHVQHFGLPEHFRPYIRRGGRSQFFGQFRLGTGESIGLPLLRAWRFDEDGLFVLRRILYQLASRSSWGAVDLLGLLGQSQILVAVSARDFLRFFFLDFFGFLFCYSSLVFCHHLFCSAPIHRGFWVPSGCLRFLAERMSPPAEPLTVGRLIPPGGRQVPRD